MALRHLPCRRSSSAATAFSQRGRDSGRFWSTVLACVVLVAFKAERGATTSYTFSDMHGPGVNLSENNTVITAVGMDSAMAYTDMPIPVGKPFAMKVLNSGIIRFGFTTFNSTNGPFHQWISNSIHDSNFWLWFRDGVYNGNFPNRKDNFFAPYNLEQDNEDGHVLGMVVYPDRELHLLVDENDIGTPWSNLPPDQPLYGVVGLENGGYNTRAKLVLTDVPTVGLDQDSYTAYESAGYLRVCATAFVDGFVGSFTVSLSSTDISAIATEDYRSVHEDFTFHVSARTSTQCALVALNEDSLVEETENFTISLALESKSCDSPLFLTTTTATVHILDSSSPTGNSSVTTPSETASVTTPNEPVITPNETSNEPVTAPNEPVTTDLVTTSNEPLITTTEPVTKQTDPTPPEARASNPLTITGVATMSVGAVLLLASSIILVAVIIIILSKKKKSKANNNSDDKTEILKCSEV